LSLIKKSDIKNHLSARHHKRIHIVPVSQPDATGFSGTNQAPVETSEAAFKQDFIADHTTSGTAVAPCDGSIGSPQPETPAAFGTAKV
jgi:hypothetical protein